MAQDPFPGQTDPTSLEQRLRALFQSGLRVSDVPLEADLTLWYSPTEGTLNFNYQGKRCRLALSN